MYKIINKINYEIQLLIHAISFLTIIPTNIPTNIPAKTNYKKNNLNHASFYFPIVGYIIGASSYIIFYILNLIIPKELAILIGTIISPIIIEGAIHKDGLADFFDAFTLSKHKKKIEILNIMKDHYIGSYGTLALILVTLIQFISLNNIKPEYLATTIILAHGTSRLIATSFIHTHKYARNTKNNNKAEIWTLSLKELIILTIIVLAPIIVIFKNKSYIIIISQMALWLYLARLLNKRIQGYTGDTLGASKELAESLFYINILIIS